MKTKKIKGYTFCVDGFGKMPIWSLMHPTKESDEAYLLKLNDYTISKEHDLINLLERLAKIDEMWFSIYITGTIKYEILKPKGIHSKDEEINVIKELKIDKIEIENDKEKGQP